MSALVFDCDGVLADTERDGHRLAFNQTFREFGVPVEWDESEYGRRLQIAGGKERMASLLTPEFVAGAGGGGQQRVEFGTHGMTGIQERAMSGASQRASAARNSATSTKVIRR